MRLFLSRRITRNPSHTEPEVPIYSLSGTNDGAKRSVRFSSMQEVLAFLAVIR